MRILASDTSCDVCSVALAIDEKRFANREIASPKTHSENYMYLLDQVLSDFEMSLKEVDLYVLVNGPGSFTGTRIAVTANKCFSYAANKKCMLFNSLEVMAYPYMKLNGTLLISLINARNERAFSASYLNGKEVIEPGARFLEELFSTLFEMLKKGQICCQSILLITSNEFADASRIFKEVEKKSGANLRYEAISLVSKPLAINALSYAQDILQKEGLLKGDYKDLSKCENERLKWCDEVKVLYLAKTQAERMRDLKESKM